MKKVLIIKVDTNDGDYNTSINTVNDDQLEALTPVFKAIKAFKPYETEYASTHKRKWKHSHNWPTGDCCREDLGEKRPEEIYKDKLTQKQVEMFGDLLPYGEYGSHTIVEITVRNVESEIKYL